MSKKTWSYINKNHSIEINYKDGVCIYKNENENSKSTYKTVFSIYNSQYEPLIIEEEYKMIICSYEYGLVCYDFKNGKIIWHIRKPRIKQTYLYKNTIVYEQENKAIVFINYKGEFIKEIKNTNLNTFYKINNDALFYGTFKNNFYIYNMKLDTTTHKINTNTLNINNCLSFCITEAQLQNNTLHIRGFESCKNGDYLDDEVKWFDRELNITDFKL